MNPYKEKELLWDVVDELHDAIVAGVEKFNQINLERNQLQRESDSLRQENRVLWEELVAQQQLIESQQKLVESQQKLIMEMRRMRSARVRYEAQERTPKK